MDGIRECNSSHALWRNHDDGDGVKLPLDYFVFSAFATALLIRAHTNHNELPSESKAA
jgi:hypothetical protein